MDETIFHSSRGVKNLQPGFSFLKGCIALLLLMASTLGVTPVSAVRLPCNSGTFDLGTGETGGIPDADGAADAKWTTLANAAGNAGPAYSHDEELTVWVGSSEANWINSESGLDGPEGVYTYQRPVTIGTAASVPSYVHVDFRFAADNGVNFLLNGIAIGGYLVPGTGTTPQEHQAFTTFHHVQWTGIVHGGTNTLTAEVTNHGGLTGFIVIGSLACIPEPRCGDPWATMEGEAFNLDIRVHSPGSPDDVVVDRLNDQKVTAATSPSDTRAGVVTSSNSLLSGLVTVDAGIADSRASISSTSIRASAAVQRLAIFVSGSEILSADLLQAAAHTTVSSTPTSDAAGSELTGLRVLGNPYGPNVAPNTQLVGPGFTIILNEQDASGSTFMRVNMIHLYVYAPLGRTVEVIVSSAFTNCEGHASSIPPAPCALLFPTCCVLDRNGLPRPIRCGFPIQGR
jgi:hypothetical protein